MKKLIFFTVLGYMIIGVNIAFNDPPANAQQVDTPYSTKALIQDNIRATKDLKATAVEAAKEKTVPPTQKPKVVTKIVTKTVQPKSIRVYYRVNGEVVSENVLTKEGDFFILDIDSVLPEVLPEPDPIKESVQDFKLDTIEKKKWWQFKRK